MKATTEVAAARPHARSARWVAAGILLSRIAGLVRDRLLAMYLGTSIYADAFRAALRMPNVIQNLLGEGTLSASFIPVYAELLERGREEEAGRVAGAAFALLLAVAGVLALFGILLAPILVDVLLPGFEGTRRAVTVASVRIIFPMTGLLVLSVWALGILNSHRRFFISYVAPVAWNAAMIATLVFLGGRLEPGRLVIALSWGALVGGLLQFLVQLPWVIALERRLVVRWDTRLAPLRQAVRNAGPAVLGRGVVQLSGWVDLFLASLLIEGAVAALGYAQALYVLPISLFGMSVAAAELPELARRRADPADALALRVSDGLRQIAFLVVPSMIGYAVLGDIVVAALFQTGTFGVDDTILVYLILVGYTVGLLASTGARLLASTFYALHDTRTPAWFAFVRVLIAGVAGYLLMRPFDDLFVLGRPLGPVGLSIATGMAAWLEWGLLRRTLRRRLGGIGVGGGTLARMLVAALVAAVLARVAYLPLAGAHPLLAAAVVLPAYGAAYFLLAHGLGVAEASRTLDRVRRIWRP